jgi:uncharacterized protein (DUF3084 family)
MTRLSSLLIAAVLAAGIVGDNLESSKTSSVAQTSAEKGPVTKEPRKTERQKKREGIRKAREDRRLAKRKSRAERRAIRQARQPICRAQAAQKHLRGAARAVYIYQCVRR